MCDKAYYLVFSTQVMHGRGVPYPMEGEVVYTCVRAQYCSRASYYLLSSVKVKILSCDTTVSCHKRVVTSLSCTVLCILQNVPIVPTIFLQGPHIKDSP